MSTFFNIKSISELFRFMELGVPRHPLIAFIDFSKQPFSKEIPVYKVLCDFYQISFKGDKNGFIKYGRESYDYQEGSLLYIAPNQVVNYGTIEDEINSGWTLFFHPDLLRTFSLDVKMKEYGFFHYQSNEALHISEKEKETILSIIEKIQTELNSNIDDFSEELIVSNLELLLNYSKRYYNRQFITRKRFKKDVVIEFHDHLRQYYQEEKQKELGLPSLQYFADKLNYSPNYLNELIKKSTDKNILEHIHYKVIEMAKNKLLNSDVSVSEIAYELGFEYPQYFSRLFKKKTGMTPLSYRKVS